MYGSQPPGQAPYFYTTSAGPPQPEWQQPPSQHGPQWQGSESLPPPPPPPPSQPGTSVYNPNTYGIIHGAAPSISVDTHIPPRAGFPPSGVDTLRWGVRYNQQQQVNHQHQASLHGTQSSAPPLPPRPASSLDHSHIQSPVAQSASWTIPPPQPNQQSYPPNQSFSVADQQPSWEVHTYPDPKFGSSQPIPPPPPPLPPGYQSDLQQNSLSWAHQPTYSDHPPAHHYDPPQQQQPTLGPSSPVKFNIASSVDYTAPSGSSHDLLHTPPPAILPPPQTGEQSKPVLRPMDAAPTPPYVSPPRPAPAVPVTTQPPAAAPSAFALGTGGPSDWEHFSASVDEIDDTASFNFKEDKTVKHTDTFELPSSHSPRDSRTDNSPFHKEPTPGSLQHVMYQNEPAQVQKSSAVAVIETSTVHPGQPSFPTQFRHDNAKDSWTAASADHGSGITDSAIHTRPQPISMETKTETGSTQSKEPVERKAVSSTEQPASATPTQIQSSQPRTTTNAATQTEDAVSTPAVKEIDPYEDLDPFYKSSLTRYVTMLRKEMAAESDAEKFRNFTAFLSKESKLREVLYGIEPTAEATSPKPPKTGSSNQAVPQQSVQHSEVSTVHPDAEAEGPEDNLTYSPGGRPIFPSSAGGQAERGPVLERLQRSASHPIPPLQIRNRQNSLGVPGSVNSLSRTAGQLANLPRSTSVPPSDNPSLLRNQRIVPLTSESPRPVYTPFRYSEGPQRGSENLAFDRPAYQAYSALRQASAESGRAMAQPNVQHSRGAGSLDVPTTARGEHDETFLGLIREKSVAYRGKRPGAVASKIGISEARKDNANVIFDELRTLIPVPFPDLSRTAQTAASGADLDKFPDDFSFVERTVDAWDREAKDRGALLDKQRRARQEESEHHIDALFNEKEIGYSDINVLEDEFRQAEAQKQRDEERSEFDKYMDSVFNPVDGWLKAEISKLEAQYSRALDLLNSEKPPGDAQSDRFKVGKCQLSHAMGDVVDIFQKLELRYQKRVDALLERERRRKKAERRIYMFLGDSASLKQLERDFDVMEKRNILDAAKDRDDRANKLMDLFDEASMRGLGENQSLLDDIAAKVKKIDARTSASLKSASPQSQQIMSSACALVQFLGADSEFILQSFGMADRFLNDADYNVSVSEARLSNANSEIFRRLEEEKKKEDHKIQDDLDSRMESVRKGHQAILANIRDVLEAIEKDLLSRGSTGTGMAPASNGAMIESAPILTQAPSTVTSIASTLTAEEEQQARLRKALDEAKRRNATKPFS